MIKPPSVQNEFTLIYSGDPALKLPDDEDERKRVLEQARETGDWKDLLNGEPPTLFHLTPLFGEDFNWWHGECLRASLGSFEAAVLALRLTLKKIENLNVQVAHERVGKRKMVTDKTIESLYREIGPEALTVIGELSNFIIDRAAAPLRPKS